MTNITDAPSAETLRTAVAEIDAPPDPDVLAAMSAQRAATMTAADTPTLTPPAEESAAADGGIAGWVSGKKITATYSTDGPRNCWAAVDGVGWRRLSPANDSCHLNLAMIAAHAEQTGATVNYHEASDGTITEMYVW